jgi:hypothetical protein
MTDFPFSPLSESYSYLWGWPSRAEGAESVAVDLQRMAGLLADAEPAYGELWPLFGMKDLGPSDPGPILALSIDDLARLIDRRARFDPPQTPAPVGKDGYRALFSNNRRPRDPLYASVVAHVGIYSESFANAVELQINPNGPGWQKDALVRRIFEDGLALWRAEWGAVWHRCAADGLKQWPRLAWTADRFASHSVPPYSFEHPFPFPFDSEPVTRSTHPDLGGELEEWREVAPRTTPPP